jgi:hypothetical protein
MLRHQPVLTFDVDLWVDDSAENLNKVADALRELGAEWGDAMSNRGDQFPRGLNGCSANQFSVLPENERRLDRIRYLQQLLQ